MILLKLIIGHFLCDYPLQGVLRASDPQVNGSQNVQPANEVPLASVINAASDWAWRTAKRLESILERLEV